VKCEDVIFQSSRSWDTISFRHTQHKCSHVSSDYRYMYGHFWSSEDGKL